MIEEAEEAEEAAPQPSGFTATYTIKVTGIKTKTIGDLADVVCSVTWVLEGTEKEQSFELPQETILDTPTADSFQALGSLTEEVISGWIEATETRMPGIKSHIQYVLDDMISKASFTTSPLPWAPVVEETVIPGAP